MCNTVAAGGSSGVAVGSIWGGAVGKVPSPGGVWIAYFPEGDDEVTVVTAHDTEVGALRAAVDIGGSVKFVAWGEDIGDACCPADEDAA